MVPSSKVLTMTAFLPACLPLRTRTTLPALRNFGMFLFIWLVLFEIVVEGGEKDIDLSNRRRTII